MPLLNRSIKKDRYQDPMLIERVQVGDETLNNILKHLKRTIRFLKKNKCCRGKERLAGEASLILAMKEFLKYGIVSKVRLDSIKHTNFVKTRGDKVHTHYTDIVFAKISDLHKELFIEAIRYPSNRVLDAKTSSELEFNSMFMYHDYELDELMVDYTYGDTLPMTAKRLLASNTLFLDGLKIANMNKNNTRVLV